MNKTKIDWCDMTWNPITGCLHGCEYCYARKIANRFKGNEYQNKVYAVQNCSLELHESKGYGFYKNYCISKPVRNEEGRIIPYPFGFKPTFHKYRLDEPSRKTKGQTIFVCSMADLFGEWVPDSWIEDVFKACEKAPQHRYLFLTKNPKRYIKILTNNQRDISNLWFGTTITTNDMQRFAKPNTALRVNTFLSIEPILEAVRINAKSFDWVIVGAETGNRKDKVIPKKEWIMSLRNQCRESNSAIFMKESLRELMGNDFTQEFPW